MLKDTKKATNSQWSSCLKFYYFRNIPRYASIYNLCVPCVLCGEPWTV